MILFQGVMMWFVKSKRAQNEVDYETWIFGGVTPTLNAMDNNGEAFATVLILFEATRVDDVRIHEKVSGTVPTYWGTGGARVPYWNTNPIRRLTPVECERLQGFPDNWTDNQADSNRYKQMGNAVAVPVVEWIISRMVAQIGE
jgi:site-specific DNA-cytosine methylase